MLYFFWAGIIELPIFPVLLLLYLDLIVGFLSLFYSLFFPILIPSPAEESSNIFLSDIVKMMMHSL